MDWFLLVCVLSKVVFLMNEKTKNLTHNKLSPDNKGLFRSHKLRCWITRPTRIFQSKHCAHWNKKVPPVGSSGAVALSSPGLYLTVSNGLLCPLSLQHNTPPGLPSPCPGGYLHVNTLTVRSTCRYLHVITLTFRSTCRYLHVITLTVRSTVNREIKCWVSSYNSRKIIEHN